MRLLSSLSIALIPYAAAHDPIVTVLNGSYSGLHLPQFDQDLFLGIPYAQNAGGPNRFRSPQSLNTSWTGTRNAKEYSHACPDFNPEDDALYGMSEDCLSINIIRPAGIPEDEELPVAVWIHGGSYQVGTSGLPNYNLTYFVERSVQIGKPIIGTSINYRKGGWGNMYSIEIQVGSPSLLAEKTLLTWTKGLRQHESRPQRYAQSTSLDQ